VTSLSLHPDVVGLDTGVHLVADAGSAGEATLKGLIEYVIPSARTAVRAWLNISAVGLVTMREDYDIGLLDPARAAAALEAHRDAVRGVKVRSSGAIVGALGVQPLQLGRLAARTAAVPLLVHIGEPPPLIEDVLELLEPGDVVTHCFHGKLGHPWSDDGQPTPALQRALDRGVLLDVGHGAASFNFGIAERALAAGHLPHTISTDVHIRNVEGPVFDLATTMSKLHSLGMALPNVVRAVTETPARILGEPDWCGLTNPLRRATLFRLSSQPTGRVARDAIGAIRNLDCWIVPVGIVTDGKLQLL